MREPHSPVTGDDSGLWSAPDDQASEFETTGFMRALVRLTKPALAVEVGAYRGHTSHAIGFAMNRNGRGHLHAFEANPARAEEAGHRCEGLPVTIHASLDTNTPPDTFGPIDLLFIDGELDNREASYDHWLPQVAARGLVAIHDTLKYAEVSRFVERIPYPRVDFVTPRGLTVTAKTDPRWRLL